MRFIDRTSEPKPSILSSPEVLKAKEAIGDHYRLASDVRVGRRVPVNSNFWLDKAVRSSLQNLFHNKCAFCEAPLQASSAEVDHFRPLANAQNPTRKQQSPDHYGWFAYEWRNLLYVCVSCNRAKANLFPVNGPRAPVLCSWDEAQKIERCELLDPCSVQSWRHLAFGWDGLVSGKTSAGKITISLLALNRPELVEARRNSFSECLQAAREIPASSPDRSSIGLSQLRALLSPEAPFSGGASILFYDAFREVARSYGLPAPSRARIAQSIERLARSFGDFEWSRVQQYSNMRLTDIEDGLIEVLEVDWRITQQVPSIRLRRALSAQICHVRIENFKGISELSLAFPKSSSNDPSAPCTMLLGENSTGKSSVLQAIALCLMGDSLRKKLRLKPEDFLPREAKSWQFLGTRRARITVTFDSASSPVTLEIDPAKGEFVSQNEPGTILMSYGARRYFGKPARRINPVSGIRSLFDPLAMLNHPGLWLEKLGRNEFAAVSRAMREILALRPDDNIERDEEGRVFVNTCNGFLTKNFVISRRFQMILMAWLANVRSD